MGGVNRQGLLLIIGQSTCTNHRNEGRTSTDRSTKATLMLTVPRSNNKVVYNGFDLTMMEIIFQLLRL